MINPALLRGTLLWPMHKQPLYTPLAHFQVQGYPIFEDEPARASFADAVMSLTDTEQRSVAGNGMHASCAGLAMMFLLALTSHASMKLDNNSWKQSAKLFIQS